MQQEDDGSNHYARGHEVFDPKAEYERDKGMVDRRPVVAVFELFGAEADAASQNELALAAFRRAALGYIDQNGNAVQPNDYVAAELVPVLALTLYESLPQSPAPEDASPVEVCAHEAEERKAASERACRNLFMETAHILPRSRKWRGAKVPYLLYTKLALAQTFLSCWRVSEHSQLSLSGFRAFEHTYRPHVEACPATAEKLYQLFADVVKAQCAGKGLEVAVDLDRWILYPYADELRVPLAQARARIIGREEAGKEAHREALMRAEE